MINFILFKNFNLIKTFRLLKISGKNINDNKKKKSM